MNIKRQLGLSMLVAGKPFALFCLLLAGCMSSFAQEEQEAFKPSGKPVALLFFDYRAGLGSANDVSGFDITRAYLGYEYRLTKSLMAKIVLDVADPVTEKALDRMACFKFAMLSWEYRGFSVDFGLTGLADFHLQERFWGYRYIAMSFQDLNKMGFSADLGIVARYHFTEWIEADVSFSNGEGYKKLNKNNSNRYAIGTTIRPLEGLALRASGNIYTKSADLYPVLPDGDIAEYQNQYTLSLFAGYQHRLFSIGAEYNSQTNNSFVEGCDYSGYSVYTTVPLWTGFKFFGRFDYLDTQTPEGVSNIWNPAFARNMCIAGVEYQLMKQLKIAPNYQFIERQDDTSHYIFLNLEFRW